MSDDQFRTIPPLKYWWISARPILLAVLLVSIVGSIAFAASYIVTGDPFDETATVVSVLCIGVFLIWWVAAKIKHDEYIREQRRESRILGANRVNR